MSQSTASQDDSLESFEGEDPRFWDEVDVLLSPSKPWRDPALVPNSPSTPFRGRESFETSNDVSPVKRGSLQTALAMSRTMSSVRIDDEEDNLFRGLLFPDKNVSADLEGIEESDEEVANLLMEHTFKVLQARSPMEHPPPIQPSSTQSSIETSGSSDSLFPHFSRTSSTSSVWSVEAQAETRTSPQKRGADHEELFVSPSPAKSRKTSPSPCPPLSVILSEVLGNRYGSAFNEYIIFHSDPVLKGFDDVGVPFGVQWELSRGVRSGKWTAEEVAAKIPEIKAMASQSAERQMTNSLIAPHVLPMMRGSGLRRNPADARDLSLWNEVDREQKAFKEGNSMGLGLSGEWQGVAEYYGGQIQFSGRLVKHGDTYDILLDKPQKRRSHRFARDHGSASFIHLSIPLKLVRDEEGAIQQFLAQRFLLNGRVFLAIPPRDISAVYLIQVNENYQRKPLAFFGDQRRTSFVDFLVRHNPPELNAKQPFAKWATRFALGLSTSIPVLQFEKESIMYIPDVLATGCEPRCKPTSEQIMTDGCGFINHAALIIIAKRVGYNTFPVAVQGRIAGAKGLWVLHPTDTDQSPRIWIRESQRKIHLHGSERVHRIFDLLRASHPSDTEGQYELSEQSILNLSANGVPDEVLVRLLEDGLTQKAKQLMAWGPGEMQALWRAVERAGSVGATRIQRFAGGRSRALGHRDWERTDSDAELADTETDVVADELGASSPSGRDMGGGPLSLYEKVLELLQAGFNPHSSKYTNDKVKRILKLACDAALDKHKISLPECVAAAAFVVPDPLGILKAGEIFYRSSAPIRDTTTQAPFHTLVGPVILGRYPIRLPCDMQKVTAVDVPELHRWTDVVITSTVGKQSLLSLLSGGDYDGDTVIFIWLKEFLEHFENKDFTPAPEGFMNDHFERDVQTVEEVVNEMRGKTTEEAQRSFQQQLIAGLRDSKVGLYSIFHDNAIYHYGYDHPYSILMAYIGNALLDAGKTGLRLKSGVFERHQQMFGNPKWRDSHDPGSPFILHKLSNAAKQRGDELLQEFELLSGTLHHLKDKVLLRPYEEALAKSTSTELWAHFYSMAVAAIERQVDATFEQYSQVNRLQKHEKQERATIMMLAHRKFAEPIPSASFMSSNDIEEIKASYAYSKTEHFGFEVAFATLCTLKARAAGGLAPNCRNFDELKTISGSASRAMQDDF